MRKYAALRVLTPFTSTALMSGLRDTTNIARYVMDRSYPGPEQRGNERAKELSRRFRWLLLYDGP
jgi:hypothetical protein